MKLSNVNNLQIIAVHTVHGFLPNAIRFFTNRWANHTGSIVKTDNGIVVFEATKEGAISTPFEHYVEGIKRGCYEIIFYEPDNEELMLDGTEEIRWKKFFKDYVNKIPYDFANLLIFQPIKITLGEWLGGKGERAFKRQICQELSFNHIKAAFPYDVQEDGAEANILDIEKYYIQCSDVINKNNIENFLKF